MLTFFSSNLFCCLLQILRSLRGVIFWWYVGQWLIILSTLGVLRGFKLFNIDFLDIFCSLILWIYLIIFVVAIFSALCSIKWRFVFVFIIIFLVNFIIVVVFFVFFAHSYLLTFVSVFRIVVVRYRHYSYVTINNIDLGFVVVNSLLLLWWIF